MGEQMCELEGCTLERAAAGGPLTITGDTGDTESCPFLEE